MAIIAPAARWNNDLGAYVAEDNYGVELLSQDGKTWFYEEIRGEPVLSSRIESLEFSFFGGPCDRDSIT